MGKYKYVAYVNCKSGSTLDTKNIEFIADEKNFQNLDSKDQNKVALRFVKNQSAGEIARYEKVDVSGYYQKERIDSEKSYSRNRSSSIKYPFSSRKLFSYNVFLIPFVLTWRILKGLRYLFKVLK